MRLEDGSRVRDHRPAVFVFNHQSQLDALVIAWVLRRDFTAVVKQEARRYPIFGYLMDFIGVLFIDRAKPAAAIETLRPAVDLLRSGVAVAVAPEGQVSPTASLRAFKKGAFHLAIQAGVPIVPVVIRNAGAVLWRSSALVDPGEITVTLLPPIDTRDWRVDSIDEHVRRVRAIFERELADSAPPNGTAHDA
ncbi:lysophospholipid acyltransferase family protein [Nocardia sp. NPDC127579]|uniref:lysophospholipid acyltransferase family protein n=1 Tax=Nocardia sp. NPDC127579 TaxID=3345402 RepID=UPI00363FE1C0